MDDSAKASPEQPTEGAGPADAAGAPAAEGGAPGAEAVGPPGAEAAGEETINLGDLGSDAFTPYVFDRNPAWGALPVLALAAVALHLIRTKPGGRKSLRTGAELSPLKQFERGANTNQRRETDAKNST